MIQKQYLQERGDCKERIYMREMRKTHQKFFSLLIAICICIFVEVKLKVMSNETDRKQNNKLS